MQSASDREAAAIAVSGISKTFRLPHTRRTTLKEHFLHPFHRTDYETQIALSDVSFTISRGDFFGIVGNNGSGKSTLMKIIASIYRQDKGTVVVNGLLSPFIELGVGFNFELTARDNIKINATLLGLTKSDLEERFDSIVAFAGLERFVDQKLKNFSSGMQVRLAYSIAIQVPFDILLLDEVLAVGDQEFQGKCFDTFASMHAEGKTIVLVSHDLEAVASLCDRAVLLNAGVVQAYGPADEVVEIYTAGRVSRGRDAVAPSG